jgi:hypothetical protein
MTRQALPSLLIAFLVLPGLFACRDGGESGGHQPDEPADKSGETAGQAGKRAEPSSQHPWRKSLGNIVTLEGTAWDAKLGALLRTEEGDIWIDGLASWPGDLHGKKVRVGGRVILKKDLPVFIRKPGQPEKTGMPVREGTDLEKASTRYLLADANWKLAE